VTGSGLIAGQDREERTEAIGLELLLLIGLHVLRRDHVARPREESGKRGVMIPEQVRQLVADHECQRIVVAAREVEQSPRDHHQPARQRLSHDSRRVQHVEVEHEPRPPPGRAKHLVEDGPRPLDARILRRQQSVPLAVHTEDPSPLDEWCLARLRPAGARHRRQEE